MRLVLRLSTSMVGWLVGIGITSGSSGMSVYLTLSQERMLQSTVRGDLYRWIKVIMLLLTQFCKYRRGQALSGCRV